jgi:hypothetical protein
MRFLFVLIAFVCPFLAAAGNVNLKPCPKSINVNWDKCFGKQQSADGSYEGEWREGKPNGKGIYRFPDGSRYEGAVLDNQLNGQGTLYLNDGRRYEGEWREGKPQGQVTLHWANGNRYEGAVLNGQPHGRGTLFITDGRRYEGEWREGKQHGQGINYFANGRNEGMYRDGQLNGLAIMHLNDGRKYEGEWREDKPYGVGILTFPDGKSSLGSWSNGKFIELHRDEQLCFNYGFQLGSQGFAECRLKLDLAKRQSQEISSRYEREQAEYERKLDEYERQRKVASSLAMIQCGLNIAAGSNCSGGRIGPAPVAPTPLAPVIQNLIMPNGRVVNCTSIGMNTQCQ